ncbi:MAG: CoF synthetase, partial [Candidatus Eisenbacteria bacterium]
KSIGPDVKKLEATLHTFGKDYRYLVMAYPPFARAFVDATTLDLAAYHLDLVCGGEGMSEALRTHLSRSFRSILSSYGASDLEINIGIETAFTVALRRCCAEDPALSRALFARDTPPMIFQYNALDYVIETTPEGTLLFTIVRVDGAAPKLRYDLRDIGGTMTSRELAARLRAQGIAPASLAESRSAFPLLYVFGRGDLTVAFYGAKLYPTDLEAVIQGRAELAAVVRGFQFASVEDQEARRQLEIRLELVAEPSQTVPDPAWIRDAFYDGLADANQDFREVRRMFPREALAISIHPFGTGPFAGADDRIKRKYIADA